MIKYVHTNIVAKDWRTLADFYIKVFDCTPIFPERDLSGDWLDKATSIKNVHINGIHLRMPGYQEEGSSLEIFQYNESKNSTADINKVGLAHIAFITDDVENLVKELLKNGGSGLGEIVKKEIAEVGLLTFCYTKDPEGNIIEIQQID